MLSQYAFLDLVVFVGYAALLLTSGIWFNRKSKTSHDFFLGHNVMPVWVVAISVLATSQSAATFIGGPDQGYRGDLTYLASNIGAIIAAFIVANTLMPRLYRANVFTVYELLEQRFGSAAKQYAGAVYLFGRLLASGSRLYMAALAVSMILFGNIAATNVISATAIIATVGLAYTVYGGIRTVIYSDVVQCCVYVSAAIGVLIWLYMSLPGTAADMLAALAAPADGSDSKLTLIDWRVDFSHQGVFTIWSVLSGFVLLNIAAFGLDQDMTQRMLTCKSAKDGSKALLFSVLLVIPVIALFIIIGLLLYLYYQQPESLFQNLSNSATPVFAGETVTVFMYYVLTELPAGLKAWVTIGIIAAALSTLNSGLNSMASVLVKDFIQPALDRLEYNYTAIHIVRLGQCCMALVALLLGTVAGLCYYWQQYTDMPLLQFALSVMVFSYSGLLGVYITALFTNRGSPRSILLALCIGFMVPLALQPYMLSLWQSPDNVWSIGFTWQLVIGTAVSALVCLAGKSSKPKSTPETHYQLS